jgi:TolB protein
MMTKARCLIWMALSIFALSIASFAQEDVIRTGTNLGVQKVRIAVPDFKGTNAALLTTFNNVLFSDLENSGIFDVVSKSFIPTTVPADPQELCAAPANAPSPTPSAPGQQQTCPGLSVWGNPPVNAAIVAFGNMAVSGTDMVVQGWVYDAKNANAPPVLGKEYHDEPTDANARLTAHRFADEIITRFGGGIPGIAESKIFFISNRSGQKEVWMMDYDGANQKQLTHLNAVSVLSPAVSPDGTRVAFSSISTNAPVHLQMFSLDLNRVVSFPRFAGSSSAPSWSPDGSRLAFWSSMPGDPEIYVSDSSGASPRRATAFRGPDTQPVWNPKTGAQIIWVSGRSGLPQLYMMDADGGNVQKLTEGGYAVSPAWSPNGLFVAFSWVRNYGPGAPGGADIYVMDIATKQWIQLTHNSGRNDYPSWSADNRHIVFQSTRSGREEIWTMLADGTRQQPLTNSGSNTQPNWSSK